MMSADATVALLELVARQCGRAFRELDADLPASVSFLINDLDTVVARGRADDWTVEMARGSVYRGLRCDLADVFRRLNPDFTVVHEGCWPPGLVPCDAVRQRRAQRRELELSMGERFARMLVPEAS